ncbi:uncharacterized protein MAM_06546 [Metarhizium album ARSEF 1941]|uniref:Uncharacterized protein n=1 Tax=Metarhizium album (strain ARSEF 1941) TaxID=1081103 RepID=A0A0B2WP98_METAS|nr:uncharacterized protein MAM_06546 [Metarhizium album ARSEF 1941]KHN95489.1 hypothetical protein MAM_06546 [Metarhizium album ARSEF 1941]
MADDAQSTRAALINAVHEQDHAEKGPGTSAAGAAKKKRSKRNEFMLHKYLYETKELPINELFVQKYH